MYTCLCIYIYIYVNIYITRRSSCKDIWAMYYKNIIYQVFLNFDLETPAYLHTQKHFLVCYNFGKQFLIAVD